jgi:hypothetical protein
MSLGNAGQPPAASGPAGARFEAKVGALYMLALLAASEPRGLPGAVVRAVRFQQSAAGRPLDDVTVDAINADGSEAFLDLQVKRTIDFTRSDPNFGDVVRRLWATAQKPRFATHRYEMAVAAARSSTRIERDCQQVLQWARALTDAGTFVAQIGRAGFASNGMREFVETFRHHLAAADAPFDDATVWRLLRRFLILPFDFEAPGSDYDYRAREQARLTLAPEDAGRAGDLWSVLSDEALACDAAGGALDRNVLVQKLMQTYGFRLGRRPDLRPVYARLAQAAEDALADIRDSIRGARLSRAELVDGVEAALEQSRVVHIQGASGVGKSYVLKALAERRRAESAVIVLAPGRIVPGGWTQIAHALGCPMQRNELLNELGCSGGATLFVDNIDQIADPAAWLTVRDLLRGVLESRGWGVVFTVRSENEEWRANLPDEMRQGAFTTVHVDLLSEAEATLLREANPALVALLNSQHPARTIARNLFFLSRLADLTPAQDHAGSAPANETDLARLWWRFGGGRSETGRFKRLKLLRQIGEQLIRAPGLAAFAVDQLESQAIEELLAVDTLREDRAGATVAFWHDTLRDWTVGILFDERPDLRAALPVDRPLPGTLTRGVEIAARLALDSDATVDRWLTLLAQLEDEGCHGSWRRPVLMALPRSEDAFGMMGQLNAALLADKGRRLKEIIQLMLAVETVPLAQVLSQAQTPPPISEEAVAGMVIPTGGTWSPVVAWTVLQADQISSTLIPDLTRLFQLWLLATQAQQSDVNRLVVFRLYQWLTRIEEDQRPIATTDISEASRFVFDVDNLNAVHADVRMTFLSFCHLNPPLAEQYLTGTDRNWYRGGREILKSAGNAARAAPAALADFALATLIPEEDEDRLYRRGRDRFSPFSIFEHEFMPASPGQGPFFALLEASPEDGLRLVRGLIAHAMQWQREMDVEDGRDALPVMTINFPEGAKSFEGDFGIYQWARGGTGSLIVASTLMALEAWGHKQIESGRQTGEVLHDVLGPSGSSVAFVCVAVDLMLSHWPATKGAAWPMFTTPELLQYDHVRWTQDQSGLGRFFAKEREAEHWPIKNGDLLRRPSRRHELIDKLGNYAVFGPEDILARLRQALIAANDRVAGSQHADDGDRIWGLRATAERALRMNHAEHWRPVVRTLADGREIECHEYQYPAEEVELRQAAMQQTTGNVEELNVRFGLQKALEEPGSSTTDLVARGLAWARQDGMPEDEDRYDAEWRKRTVVMAAALAARDYEGADRTAVEQWCRSILHGASADDSEDIAARAGTQIYSSKTAIAAIGYRALYRRDRDPEARDALLWLASRQDHPVLHAIGSGLRELASVDERMARGLVRLVLRGAVHPRRTLDDAEDKANAELHCRGIAEAVDAERRFLDGYGAEPDWPSLSPWHSRRRRGIRLGEPSVEDLSERRTLPPEMYVDEQGLAILSNYLVGLMIGGVRDWIVVLYERLMGWTFEANNGPPGEDEDERENRPTSWNLGYFETLGILCVTLPWERVRTLFANRIITLHDEAFLDAAAAFLRGFDRATLASDMPQPENTGAVRAAFAERVRQSRQMRYLSYETSFTAETHLGDALHALFYQPSSFMRSGRVYIPERWDGLLETLPILVPLVAGFPQSGYLAVVFLTLMESCRSIALLPAMVQAFSAWCGVHGVGARFWNEHELGNRICTWVEVTLSIDIESVALTPLRDELGRCLDVLVRSGIAAARSIEARIAEEDPLKKMA